MTPAHMSSFDTITAGGWGCREPKKEGGGGRGEVRGAPEIHDLQASSFEHMRDSGARWTAKIGDTQKMFPQH